MAELENKPTYDHEFFARLNDNNREENMDFLRQNYDLVPIAVADDYIDMALSNKEASSEEQRREFAEGILKVIQKADFLKRTYGTQAEELLREIEELGELLDDEEKTPKS